MSAHTREIRSNAKAAFDTEVKFQSGRPIQKRRETDFHSYRKGFQAGYWRGLQDATYIVVFAQGKKRIFCNVPLAEAWIRETFHVETTYIIAHDQKHFFCEADAEEAPSARMEPLHFPGSARKSGVIV